MPKSLIEYFNNLFEKQQLCFELSKPQIVDAIDGFEPDEDVFYVKWLVAHTLPMINENGLGLSLIAVERTIKSFINKSVNYEHKAVKNLLQLKDRGIELPVDSDVNPISVHIGHIVNAEVEGPFEGEKVAIPEKARKIFFTTAHYRQEPINQAVYRDILDIQESGHNPIFKASVEYRPVTSHLDNLIFDGKEIVSPQDVSEELQDKLRSDDRKPAHYNGRPVGLVVGGNTGIVGSGLGITVNPADKGTRPMLVAASMDDSIDGNAGNWFNTLIQLKLVQGEPDMLNEQWLDFLCSIGVVKADDLPKAKSALSILQKPESKDSDSKEFTDAVNNLSKILEKAQSTDVNKAIDDKVKEILNGDDYIKKDELETKIEGVIKSKIDAGELFTKEGVADKVKAEMSSINSKNEKIQSWKDKLKEKEIDIEKLNVALKDAGQTTTVEDQLLNMVDKDNADELFEKSIGMFELLSKGVAGDGINSDDNDRKPVIPQVNNRVPGDTTPKQLLESFFV